jgi:uncharacterized protein with PIN domain
MIDDERCPECDGQIEQRVGQTDEGYGDYLVCVNCGHVFDFNQQGSDDEQESY